MKQVVRDNIGQFVVSSGDARTFPITHVLNYRHPVTRRHTTVDDCFVGDIAAVLAHMPEPDSADRR